jgi:hypothetical protein
MSEGGTRSDLYRPGQAVRVAAIARPDRQIRQALRAARQEAEGLHLTRTGREGRLEKPLARHPPTVPQTDTGRRVEDTQARERTLVKELGKFTP